MAEEGSSGASRAQEQKATLLIGADASGAEVTLENLTRKTQAFGNQVVKAQALVKAGFELGPQQTARGFETLLGTRAGLDAERLKPLIEGLRELEQQQKRLKFGEGLAESIAGLEKQAQRAKASAEALIALEAADKRQQLTALGGSAEIEKQIKQWERLSQAKAASDRQDRIDTFAAKVREQAAALELQGQKAKATAEDLLAIEVAEKRYQALIAGIGPQVESAIQDYENLARARLRAAEVDRMQATRDEFTAKITAQVQALERQAERANLSAREMLELDVAEKRYQASLAGVGPQVEKQIQQFHDLSLARIEATERAAGGQDAESLKAKITGQIEAMVRQAERARLTARELLELEVAEKRFQASLAGVGPAMEKQIQAFYDLRQAAIAADEAQALGQGAAQLKEKTTAQIDALVRQAERANLTKQEILELDAAERRYQALLAGVGPELERQIQLWYDLSRARLQAEELAANGQGGTQLRAQIDSQVQALERQALAAGRTARELLDLEVAEKRFQASLAGVGPQVEAQIQRLYELRSAALDAEDANKGRAFINQLQQRLDMGKGTVSIYDQMLAKARALGREADAKPILDELAKIERGFTGVGKESRLAAQQMALVAPQITDIITQLQGGVDPFTILIQQGGQLRDIFGSADGAFRGLLGGIKELGAGILRFAVNPFVMAATAAGVLAVAFLKGQDEAHAFERALISSGNAAGTSSDRLRAYAREISASVGTQGDAAKALTALVNTGRVGAGQLEVAGEAVVRMVREMGVSAEDAAGKFADLAKDPLQAILRLNDQYRFLTVAVYDQIKALEEQGRKDEAAKLAQETYAIAMTAKAKALEQQLGLVERAARGVRDAAKGMWDALLNVGRPETLEDQLKKAEANLERLRKRLAEPPNAPPSGGRLTLGLDVKSDQQVQKEADREQSKVDLLNEQIRLRNRLAAAQGDEARAVELTNQFFKDSEGALRREILLQREIAQANEQAAAATALNAGNTEKLAEIEELRQRRIALIQQKYDTGENAVSIRAKEAEWMDYIARKQGEINQARAMGALNEAQTLDALNKLEMDRLLAQRQTLVLEQQAAQARINNPAERAQLAAALALNEKQLNEELERGRRALEAQTNAAKVRANQFGYEEQLEGEQAVADYRRQQEDAMNAIALALYEQKRYLNDNAALIEAEVAMVGLSNEQRQLELEKLRIKLRLQREIEAINKLDRSQAEKDVLIAAANENAARQSAQAGTRIYQQEWERTAGQINGSLTDAIMNAGEDGAAGLKRLFANLVLRPVVQAIMQPLSGSLASAFTPGGAGTGGGGSGFMGTLGNAANAISAYRNVTGLAGTASGLISGAGTLFGSATTAAYGAGVGLSASQAAAAAAAYNSAGMTAIGSSISAGSSLGASLTAAGPYVAAAMAIYAIAKALDKSGTPHVGSAFEIKSNGTGGRVIDNADDGWRLNRVWSPGQTTNTNMARAVEELVRGVSSTIGATLDTFNLGKVTVRGAFASDNTDPSAGRLTITGSDGEVLTDFYRRSYSKDAGKGLQQFTDDAARVIRDSLIKADLPAWADEVLKSIGEKPSMDAIVQAVEEVNKLVAASKTLGVALGLTTTEFVSVAKEVGGSDALSGLAQGYIGAIYTDKERIEAARKSLALGFGELGVSVPATKDSYRQLVEAQDLTKESGRKLYAQLLALAPVFAEVQNAWEQQVEAVRNERLGLEQRLLQVQGNTAELRRRELAALDP
uniref:phage tail length tape measure family protein n=1 Tax=Azohydromonas aeria TaxID=2590212 RepID=UPI0012F89B09